MEKIKTFAILILVFLFAAISPAFAEEATKPAKSEEVVAPAKPGEAVEPAKAEEAVEEVKPYEVGDVIETLEIQTIDGKKDKVSFEKNTTAIAFFATSCSACRAELSVLNALKKQKKDLRVLAVSVDAAGGKSVKRFIDQTKYDFDYYLDADFKIAERFGFTFSPSLVLLKPGGKIYMLKGGYSQKDEELLVTNILQ